MELTNESNLLESILNLDTETKFFIFIAIVIIAIICITKSKITNKKVCPHCKKEKAYRAGQNFLELYLLRLENYKKYKCLNCVRCFYIKNYN